MEIYNRNVDAKESEKHSGLEKRELQEFECELLADISEHTSGCL